MAGQLQMGSRTEPGEQRIQVAHRAFWLSKGGAAEAEYEDAFAVSENVPPEDDVRFRAAVADGATEAVFSGRWARLLARRFVENGPAVLGERLPAAQEAWTASVEAEAGALPWYAAAKAEVGAFAALLGLALRPPADDDSGGTWQAVAIGDGNLFQVREGELVRAWPFAQAGDFGNRPALVSSRAEAAVPEVRRAEGWFQHGDAFVLATDAAAAWLLRDGPDAALAWDGPDAFAGAAREARAGGMLENDDTTVVVVQAA